MKPDMRGINALTDFHGVTTDTYSGAKRTYRRNEEPFRQFLLEQGRSLCEIKGEMIGEYTDDVENLV